VCAAQAVVLPLICQH